jgi:hypothetical protein
MVLGSKVNSKLSNIDEFVKAVNGKLSNNGDGSILGISTNSLQIYKIEIFIPL